MERKGTQHHLVAALNAAIAPGTGREWETGVTENGDVQFYLLGPLPDQACELCVSRIGGRYILEDGSGRLLFEHRNLELVALHAKAAVPSTSWLMVRAITLWCAIRSARPREGRAAARRGRRIARPVRTAACGFRLIPRRFPDHHSNTESVMTAKSATSRADKTSRKPATGKAAASKAAPPNPKPANCRNGIWPISIPASTRPKSRAICKRWMPTAPRLRRTTRASSRKTLPATMAALARRGGQALRGDRRSRRPARLLCRPRSCRRQRRSRDLKILWRRLRAADGGLGASVVLRARTQSRRRCGDRARDADARARPLPPVDRGSAQGQAVSARGSRRAVVSRKIPERLCRLEPAVRPDHLRPALQGRGQGTRDRADAQSAAGPRAGKAQGCGAGAGKDLQGQ